MKGTRFRRGGIAALAIVALAAINLGSFASAHGADVCTFTSAAGLPANVNNVEGKGAPWTIDAGTRWWTGTSLTATGTDGFGHAGQNLQGTRRGLYYPINDPNSGHLTASATPAPFGSLPSFVGDHFNWTNIDQCQNNGAAVNTQGVGVGYCGRSVGLGTGSTGAHNAIIKWESLGSQLILTDTSAAGSLNAQPNPPGSPNGSCLSGTAVTFLLNGAIAHA